MNERLKQLVASFKDKWSKWTKVQKGIVAGIVVIVLAALFWLVAGSSRPTTVRLFNAPVTDDVEQMAILDRLDRDNIKAYVSSDGYISVDNEKIAKRYRSILIAEQLEPKKMSAYDLFNEKSWSRTDFDDKVKWQQSREIALKQQLKSLSGIRDAKVTLSLPDEALFSEQQKPTTASVILYAEPNSDALSSKKSVKGIQHLIQLSIEGLKEENISIVDGNTNQEINNFEGMEEIDRLTAVEKEQKIIQRLENEYASRVYAQLRGIYGERVGIVNVKVDMDMSKTKMSAEEFYGIEIKPDNPDTPFDDSDIRDGLVISTHSVKKLFTGTGFNPEGPSGVEGQNPAVMSDASNLIGKSEEIGEDINYEHNKRQIEKEESPQIQRMSVSVNIDGRWEKSRDKNGELIIENGKILREYKSIETDELAADVDIVSGAVGSDVKKDYLVVVRNIAVDHSAEFEKEDEAERARKQRNKTIVLILVGIAVVLLSFILFKIITREMERRRRLREEEALRKQREEREQALWDAKEQGMEVTMSVEERKRAELQENAVAMAKEHPEDVAMLIRTWLMEE